MITYNRVLIALILTWLLGLWLLVSQAYANDEPEATTPVYIAYSDGELALELPTIAINELTEE